MASERYAHTMRYRYVAWPLKAASFVIMLAVPAFSQSERDLGIYVESRGSVPPIPDWFTCVRELDKKTYNNVKARACLQSILSHPEVVKGKFSLHHYKVRDVLTFHLESPSLTVKDVDWGIGPGDLAQTHELLAINGTALFPGAAYVDERDFSSRLVLDLLLRSQGRRAGISQVLSLDYKQKTAQVAFKIWDGPRGSPQPLVPPYSEPCEIMNGYFNWMDIDDLSPRDFIERQMKTKWTGCFSEKDVHDDLAMLKRMKFLTEADISVEGSGGFKSVSIHLRSNPIPVGYVRVKGYGLLDGLKESDITPLSIHVGDAYSRSTSRDVARELKKEFMKDGRQVRVFTDVEITPDGKANLEFGILAFPNDLVYVNGAKFNGSFPDNPDMPD